MLGDILPKTHLANKSKITHFANKRDDKMRDFSLIG